MGLICTKLDITTRSSIMLSIVAMNLNGIVREIFLLLLSAFHVGGTNPSLI